ncbi:prevent-host-death family protein [Mycoplana sp. BE70]|uniref:type II toxin-antitoxin system Phd/YefM family antitoxin n=1 Tax=Mycoplana sp. BE70 TaxID=2817775 RepID=UPI00286119A1|nr:type II toxin-antitoxin system prevent-host-death family antitoxin [Mycoplana sp. BE70]MDR6757625.1 prevent-host-death family protein [Mycoplana sp. BE70]
MKIGAFDAKSQFSSLLDRAARGEEIVITKHGKSVARLVAVASAESSSAAKAFAELKELRRKSTLGDDLSWKDLRDEGRR